MNAELTRSAILTGSIVGGLAVATYVGWSVLPLPGAINRLLHFAFGPLLIVAFIGIFFFLGRERVRLLHILGSVFGILAGATFAMMTIVQASMIDRVWLPLRASDDPAVVTHLKYALQGTNSVQLGLDVAWDLFITIATVLVALSLIGRGGATRLFAIVGVAIGAATLVLNLWTFPMPPAQSGSIDLGPFVGGWFGGVCLMMAHQYRRLGRH
jgi:hypothetical protein